MGDPLPSALRRFTSEFGSRSGGTTALIARQNEFFVLCAQFFIASAALLAALVSSVTYFAYAPSFQLRLPPLLRKLFALTLVSAENGNI